MSLKFIALSGTTGVTENFYVYEHQNDMIIIDCGVGFPETDMYGADLVIPDFSYIKENVGKLKAILITHGHEDHFGALPFLLKEVKAPIYATKLVAGFIEDKFGDYSLDDYIINVFDPDKDVLNINSFRVYPFRITHSVPDSVGFCLETPQGKVFHVADYKFDWTPVDGKTFDVRKVALLASKDVLALASDSLGSTTPGYTGSEKEIEARIEKIVREAKKAIYFTTISSNISRIQQAINVAKRQERKVVFIGRSIDKKAAISQNLGFLYYEKGVVIRPEDAKEYAGEKLFYIISGSYGQVGSALYRLSLGEHEFLRIKKDDVVIFSSDPAPPGSKQNVDFVVDHLINLGADVHYYDLQEDLHVSGHGSEEDIKMLFALVRPKYFIPIGGTIRHMRSYKNLAELFGAKNGDVLELMPGEIVEFQEGKAKKAGRVPVREVLVDGLEVGDVGKVVLRDRQILAKEGIAIVLVQIDLNKKRLLGTPEIISRGFVFEKVKRGLLISAGKLLERELMKKKLLDRPVVKAVTRHTLEKYFAKKIGRHPMILPVVVEV